MTIPTTFTADMFRSEDEHIGLGLDQFGNALSAWAWMQRRDVTVAQAARAFNTSPELVIKAVADHPWMFIVAAEGTGPDWQFIEHDGE